MKLGGSTLTVYGTTLSKTLKAIRKSLLDAARTWQLWADSSVAVFNITTKKAYTYKVKYIGNDNTFFSGRGMPIRLHEVKVGKNVGMPLSVAAHYNRKPRRNEWMATVHVHT